MTNVFLGQITMFGGNYNPRGFAFCNGQLLPIAQNQALFSLLGTTFGGDGRQTFGLPDLRGRSAIHEGSGHTLGEKGGEQGHTLSITELPTHTHVFNASAAGATANPPGGNYLGQSSGVFLYGAASNLQPMGASALGPTGGSQAHPNMQPFLALNFCIALQGIFP